MIPKFKILCRLKKVLQFNKMFSNSKHALNLKNCSRRFEKDSQILNVTYFGHLWLINPHDPVCIPLRVHVDQ